MRKTGNKVFEADILQTLKYFSFFNYPPDFSEISTFLKKKASKRQITSILEKMEKRSLIKSWKMGVRSEKLENEDENEKNKKIQLLISNSTNPGINTPSQYKRYFLNNKNINPTSLPPSLKLQRSRKLRGAGNETTHLREQVKQFSNIVKRKQISVNKLSTLRFKAYLKLLSLFPQIKLVGLSGSVAMLNAAEEDDIDLFIITAKNRLWTGRIIALLFAQLLGIRRSFEINQNTENRNRKSDKPDIQKVNLQAFRPPYSDFSDKVCLNLFFDRSDLTIPRFKRTPYVAHEVLQMKPLIDKGSTYLSFIDANRWVFDIFPNSSSKFKIKNSKLQIKNNNYSVINLIFNFSFSTFNLIADKIENILMTLQLNKIREHRTTEFITDRQLWFHPDDFEKKLKL